MQLELVRHEMSEAHPYFKHLNPGWMQAIRHKVVRYLGMGMMLSKQALAIRKGKDPAEIVGEFMGGQVIRRATSLPRTKTTALHKHIAHVPKRDFWRKNGIGGRYWIYQPGRHQMVLVFHDANKAGPHIDVHIGRFSMIRRVKPEIYEQLRYNNQGMLTQDSRQVLVDFLRDEIGNQTRIPQNLDHSVRNARASWVGGDPAGTNYGDGRTRQVILEETVDVYKAGPDAPIEFYAPSLNAHRGMYVHQLYPGDDKRAPILVWGNLKPTPPVMLDRLHLKLLDDAELPALEEAGRIDPESYTAKYDGSSCYVVITDKGTSVWSPRFSKATGERIEYTFKLDGIANVTNEDFDKDGTVVVMGELLFKNRPRFPWQREFYLPQATGSGILNSNQVLPSDVKPEIRLYRFDKIGNSRFDNEPWWINRQSQAKVAALAPQHFSLVEQMSPEEAAERGYEGVVGGNVTDSVNDFYKIKWKMDPHDWRIDRVALHDGERGGIAGVVHCTSLESGKQFKLGPGQLGDHEFNRAMMQAPHEFEGQVLKVASFHGHEGRAGKVVAVHDDKGVGA